jgi:hypothetical protein
MVEQIYFGIYDLKNKFDKVPTYPIIDNYD